VFRKILLGRIAEKSAASKPKTHCSAFADYMREIDALSMDHEFTDKRRSRRQEIDDGHAG
jgi:hypothetical protein